MDRRKVGLLEDWNMSGKIFPNDLEGTRVPVKILESDQAGKTLGIMMAADGNMDAQIEYLTGKAEEFAPNLKLPSPTNMDVNWIAYKHTICKAMEYPMPVTELTQKE